MFKNAKVNDKVFNYIHQRWESIKFIACNNIYAIETEKGRYTFEGKSDMNSKLPIIFWDEVKPITPPEKPLPTLEVDTKVLVWINGSSIKFKRHFAYFDNYGEIRCYDNGLTSWTASTEQTTVWENWELA